MYNTLLHRITVHQQS